ncbi:unnamed protein product [Acanthoscelides obtectus]|uniref:Uncharacterized protein n=1 Tax=Acanthoscelides obtectus TaxID=200917 RepID=A0A9P0JPE3_ACAOB|nr:unnamed protein product [Acanthoscelides obtectus]CAK1642784.1 hypothetical protein AOBTE_LOCUS13211 [Acanthoscelides obtectus]
MTTSRLSNAYFCIHSFFFNIIWSVLCSTSKSRETFCKYLVYI